MYVVDFSNEWNVKLYNDNIELIFFSFVKFATSIKDENNLLSGVW